MSAEGYFASPDPDDYSDAPLLPEELFPRTLESMFYGETLHLVPETAWVAADSYGEVLINLDYPLDPDEASHPNFQTERYISLRRIIFRGEKDDEPTVSGFILDMRHLRQGDVAVMKEEDEEELDEYLPVIGIIYKDDTGRPVYASTFREETIQYAAELAIEVDALRRQQGIPDPSDVAETVPKKRRKAKKLEDDQSQGTQESGAENS